MTNASRAYVKTSCGQDEMAEVLSRAVVPSIAMKIKVRRSAALRRISIETVIQYLLVKSKNSGTEQLFSPKASVVPDN